MGEFESGSTLSRKKKRKSETENSEAVSEKKAKNFCCSTFRRELRTNEALKSLKKFVSAAKNSDDVIFEYLEVGGSLQEILSLIDATASGDLTTALPVFEALHLILLRFQSLNSEHHQQCIDIARIILRSHLFIMKSMLSMNITKQKKVALKVLTAIATLDSSFANEIMNVVALSPTLIADLITPSSKKESVRKCFILFVLSFLIEGNLVVVKNLLDKKGFLSSIIPGLKFDGAATVILTLSLFEDKILKNVKIPKTLKLKLFNTQIIKSLFDLYDWKGLQGVKLSLPEKKEKVKEVEINQQEKEVVIASVHSFLLLLCCSQKYGVAFYDKSMGTSDQLNNQLLLTVFESLPDPLKNQKTAEVVLKTTASCPDLMKPLLLKLEPSFQPRNSKNWFEAMEFAEKLINAVDATSTLKSESESLTTNHIIKVGKILCAPVVFLRVAKLGSQKAQPIEVQFHSLRLLTTIWGEIQKLLATFKNFQDDLKTSLYKHVFKSLPDAEDLVELWHVLCDVKFFSSLPLSQEKKVSFLSAILESLHIIVECQRDAVSSPLSLMSVLLNRVDEIKDSMREREFEDIQVKIVQFVEIDLQALTPKMELFEKSLMILLRSTEDSSLSYLSKILTSLEVFAKNKAEVDVWLLCYSSLPAEYRPSVAECLIKSIRLFFSKQTEENYKVENLIATDEIETETEESITSLIFNYIEVYKSYFSKLSKKDKKLLALRHYLNDLTIQLQHFYTIDIYLYDYLKDVSKTLSKSTLNYLKSWKDNSLTSIEPDIFSCPQVRGIYSWLLNDFSDLQNVEKIINVDNTNLLKLYSLFRLVVAHLINKIVVGDFSEQDVEKYTRALTVFLSQAPEDDRESIDLISYDVKNKAVYQRHCLNCLFQNKHLLKAFDVFQKKPSYTTVIVFKVLIREEIVKNMEIKKKLTDSWKFKFLKQLRAKLRKNKLIDGLNMLERVLNFFQYNHEDVAEVIELLSFSELDLFVNGNVPSAWIVILSKFIKMHCEKEELSGAIVKKLGLIMKHLSESCTSNLERMTDCFVYLLRKHPYHLLLIEDDFLDVVLPSTCTTLGKLLLNDPAKVQYFFKYITENLDVLEKPEIVFFLLSKVIVNENPFLDTIKDENARSVWKTSEINPKTTPELFNVLEVVFKKFEKDILEALIGEKNFILENVGFARELIKLFLDKKQIFKIKKEIYKGKFEPELLFEAVKKFNLSALTECYVQGLLTFFSRIILKSKDAEEDIPWSKYSILIVDVIKLDKELSWETVIGSDDWKNFAKSVLGYCLGSMKHPPLLKILNAFLTHFYKAEEESKDCSLFFKMVISHSQFLKVMLSRSLLKPELVELFHCLIERCPSEMSSKHFPILLASYNASLSACDQTLLTVLKFYEKRGVEVNDYEPFVWGESAVSHYSIGTSPGLSLWQRFNMGNVMDLLDSQRLELSLKDFPVRRKLDANYNLGTDTSVYDPAFLLPLFVNLLSPGAVVFCLPFIYKGGLAYTVRALSSECKFVRLAASIVLTRFYNHLELSQKLKQKLVWMHYINCFRYGIEDLASQPLPNITTLFLARMTLELSRQPAELFLPLQNFLLAKSYFAFDSVPEFFPLFHSSEISYRRHREWLLEIIRDGTKTSTDINIIFHTMAPKVIFCFFHSQLCDTQTRRLILQMVERMLLVDKSVLLISDYGLLNWITSIEPDFFHAILNDLLNLLLTLTGMIVKGIQVYKSKHANLTHLIQILNMSVKLLPSLKDVKSVDSFKIFSKILNECLLLLVKKETSDWCKLNKARLSEIVDAGVAVLGGSSDCGKFNKVPFYFRDFDEVFVCEDLKNAVFLFNMLVNRGLSDENKNKSP